MRKRTEILFCAIIIFISYSISAFTFYAEDAKANYPKLLSAHSIDAGRIKLRWSKFLPNDALYAVYRKSGKNAFKFIDYCLAENKKIQTYTDYAVLSGRKYSYAVAALPEKSFLDCLCRTSMSPNHNAVEISLSWNKPNSVKVYRYAVLINGTIAKIEKADKQKAVYTIPYSQKLSDFDFEVKAILKNSWSNHDSKGLTAKTNLVKSVIKTTKLVANNKIRVDWTKSKGAAGYILLRKNSKIGKYKKIAEVYGDSQTYCYSKIKSKQTYYYTVKSFSALKKERKLADFNKNGKKVCYKKTDVTPKKRLNSKNVYFKYGLNDNQVQQVRSAAKKFFEKHITSDMSQVEKVLSAQIFLATKCDYSFELNNKQNTAWGALVYQNNRGFHEANCFGYSMAFCALCDSMGINCRPVYPDTNALNLNHLWCMVKIGKKWYIVDPQCNANYGLFTYFLVSGTRYETETGESWNKSKYPVVSSKDYSSSQILKESYSYKINEAFK